MTFDWPIRQLCSFYSSVTKTLLPASPVHSLSSGTKSPERPRFQQHCQNKCKAFATWESGYLISFSETAFLLVFLRLSVLLPFESSFKDSSRFQMLLAAPIYILEYVHYFCLPFKLKITLQALGFLFLFFNFSYFYYLWFAGEGWKCWLLQLCSPWKST